MISFFGSKRWLVPIVPPSADARMAVLGAEKVTLTQPLKLHHLN